MNQIHLDGEYTFEALRHILCENAAEYFGNKPQILQDHHAFEELQKYFGATLFNNEREYFGILFLDTRHHVLAGDILFKGTVDQSAVYPREVGRQALLQNASAIIVAHNHPGGTRYPSREDIRVTRDIKKVLDVLDIRLLDHIIVSSSTKCYSMSHEGDFDFHKEVGRTSIFRLYQ